MSLLTLYAGLATSYAKAIQTGAIQPGSRLPSVRELARTHKISLTTAVKVYRTLEEDGLVHARPRSGYFANLPKKPNSTCLKKQATPSIPENAQYIGTHTSVSNFVACRVSSSPWLDLSQASAAFDLYPAEALRVHLMRALRMQPQLFCEAPPLQGASELRKALASHALKSGAVIAPNQILITSGATEAINLALKAVSTYGDIIAVESPTFYGLFQILESLGLQALEIPTQPETGFSVDALELALDMGVKVKAVIVTPILQNPLGCSTPDIQKKRLLKLCEKYQIALIEDDPYRDLLDATPPPQSIKSLDKSGLVIYCASLHKILAPGIRLGWITAGRWHSRVEILKYAKSHNTDGLSQSVVAKFLLSNDYERHLTRFRSALHIRISSTLEMIYKHFPKNIRINKPQGGMQLWIELPERCSAQLIYEQAAKQGVLIAPGNIFCNNNKYNNFIRINTSGTCNEKKEKAIQMLGNIILKSL